MNIKTATIFDIKQFAVHDGPGIRTTVFFKGCPLYCWWCHNPEGISTSVEIFLNKNKCINDCKQCIEICPENAIIKNNQGINIIRENCTLCVKCSDICPSDSIKKVGYEIKLEDLMKEIRKSIIYYDSSEGGVTLSGGEPLLQIGFIRNLLKACKDENIHTTLDTSGYATIKSFKSVVDYVDLFLFDLKLLDEGKHLKYTGKSFLPIIKNLKYLINRGKGKDIIIRFPLVPGITDTEENVGQITDLILSLKGINRVDLLPFHNVTEKYERLGKDYRMGNTPYMYEDRDKLKSIKDTFENKRLSVKIGG